MSTGTPGYHDPESAGARFDPGGPSIRLRLDLGYDGTDFSGWARQPGRRTVQTELESALGRVLRITPPSLTVAGRTDAGVHARGQVCHVDVPESAWLAAPGRSDRPAGSALVQRLNAVLPADIRVVAAEAAPTGFHARFSALWRRYVYRIADHPAAASPLTRRHVYWHRRALDVQAMDAAAVGLIGEHDFAAFCKARDGATTIRTLRAVGVGRDEAGLVTVSVEADAFCHNQIRAMVGALLAVGDRRRPVSWPADVLAAGRRDSGVTVAPPHGLTLEAVGYPPDGELAARAAMARNRRSLPGAPTRRGRAEG